MRGARSRRFPGQHRNAHTTIAKKNGVTVAYNARALSLIADDDGVKGIRVKHDGRTVDVKAKCVVLAAGGFQVLGMYDNREFKPTDLTGRVTAAPDVGGMRGRKLYVFARKR